MSKIAALKEWFTIPEAAKYLSRILNEEVNEPDILRFALTGKLTLSVYFVNGTICRQGKVVPKDKARKSLIKEPGTNEMIEIAHGVTLKNGDVIELEKEVLNLEGVWDLPMIGSEVLELEQMLMNEIKGPNVTSVCLDGVFVSGSDGKIYQLLNRFDHNFIKLNEKIYNRKRDDLENYFPGGIFPEDSVIVVLSDRLNSFVANIKGREIKSLNKSASDLGKRGKAAQDLPNEAIYLRIIEVARKIWESGERIKSREMLDLLWSQYMNNKFCDHNVIKLSRESLNGRLKPVADEYGMKDLGRPKKKN